MNSERKIDTEVSRIINNCSELYEIKIGILWEKVPDTMQNNV
jgi:hypothetical protein